VLVANFWLQNWAELQHLYNIKMTEKQINCYPNFCVIPISFLVEGSKMPVLLTELNSTHLVTVCEDNSLLIIL
jgi:hypothetical protein